MSMPNQKNITPYQIDVAERNADEHDDEIAEREDKGRV